MSDARARAARRGAGDEEGGQPGRRADHAAPRGPGPDERGGRGEAEEEDLERERDREEESHLRPRREPHADEEPVDGDVHRDRHDQAARVAGPASAGLCDAPSAGRLREPLDAEHEPDAEREPEDGRERRRLVHQLGEQLARHGGEHDAGGEVLDDALETRAGRAERGHDPAEEGGRGGDEHVRKDLSQHSEKRE